MTVPLTATPVAPTATTNIPANGEGVDSDSVALYVQKQINEGKYRDNKIANLESLVAGSNPTDFYTIKVPICAFVTTNIGGPANWFMSYSTFGTRPFLSSTDSTSADVIFDLSPYLPNVGKIVQCDVLYRGASSHGGLPGTMPQRILLSQAYGFGATTDPAASVLSSIADGTALFADYQKLHVIGGPMAPVTIDNSLQYLLRVIGPDGANLGTGDQILGLTILASG